MLRTLVALAVSAAAALCQDSRPSAAQDAGRAVAEIEGLVAARRFADAWKKAAALGPLLADDSIPGPLRVRARRVAIVAGIEVIGPAAAFRGAVSTGDQGVVEVGYDFGVAGWED